MKKIAFVTDTSSGLKNLEIPNVYVVPLNVLVTTYDDNNEATTKSYQDQIECTNHMICEWLKSDKKINIKTSQASLGEIQLIINQICDKYDEIYVIPIASTASGSENSWRIIAQDEPKIHIVHQHMGGPMLKWIIKDLISLSAEDNFDISVLNDYIKKSINKIFGIMLVKDIKQLKNGGRVTKLTSLVLQKLNFSLLISLDEKGMKLFRVIKNFDKLPMLFFKYFNKKIQNFDDKAIEEIMFIRNTNEDKSLIDSYIQQVKNRFKQTNVKITEEIMPAVLIAHAGLNSFICAIKLK